MALIGLNYLVLTGAWRMIPELSLTGSTGWVLLLVPLAVLLISALSTQWTWGRAAAAAWRSRQEAQGGLSDAARAAPDQARGMTREGAVLSEQSIAAGLAGTIGAGRTQGREPGRSSKPNTETGEHRSQSPIAALGGQPRSAERAPAVRRVFAVREMIADAEKTGDRRELAKLCLSQARYLREGGELREAGDLVRKCILIAIEMRDDRLHAQGRLELGDIAESLGDLTTACEHWQMARSLFTDVEEHQRSESAEQRMLKRGCPTDWVLTDF